MQNYVAIPRPLFYINPSPPKSPSKQLTVPVVPPTDSVHKLFKFVAESKSPQFPSKPPKGLSFAISSHSPKIFPHRYKLRFFFFSGSSREESIGSRHFSISQRKLNSDLTYSTMASAISRMYHLVILALAGATFATQYEKDRITHNYLDTCKSR